MARSKTRESKQRVINPTFFVFCEGETEESYVRYLRSKYRLPVEVISKITCNKITERLIKENIKLHPNHPKDRVFLMYDLDVEGFYEKLQSIQKKRPSELIVSNPCFELWLLLHSQNQTAEIKSDSCIRKVESLFPNYQKGTLNEKVKIVLDENVNDAIKRAKSLKDYQNPSTNMYLFIEAFEEVRSKR